MNTLLFNAISSAVVFGVLVAAFYWIPKFLRKSARKSFLDEYGKFIGKKGFFDATTETFLDENKKPVPELSEFYFSGIYGFDGLIPCILQESSYRPSSLDIIPQKFMDDYEVKYVGKIMVLYHPEYGELTCSAEKLKTRPTVGSFITLCGDFRYDSLCNSWDFFWSEA